MHRGGEKPKADSRTVDRRNFLPIGGLFVHCSNRITLICYSTANKFRQLLLPLARKLRKYSIYLTNTHQRFALTTVGCVGLAVVVGLMLIYLMAPDYGLTSQAEKLVNKPDRHLAEQIVFSTKTHAYVINRRGLRVQTVSPSNPSITVGQPTRGLYTAMLPINISRGITVTDNSDHTTFSLTPEFKTAAPKLETGHIVYPAGDGKQVIYTPQAYQLAEDVLLNHRIGNQLRLSYNIDLPKGLIAVSNADGGILISKQGKALFELAVPIIKESDGKPGGKRADASTRLILNHDSLTLVATGLSKLSYPITIDPSILISSANGFLNGNNEGDISASSNQIGVSGLSGGEVGGWASTGNANPTAYAGASVTYNGYVYQIGGLSSNTLSSVYYAPINSNGTIGGWSSTSSLACTTDYMSAEAYNGYIYVIGGYTNNPTTNCSPPYATVYYAPINSNGSLGAWQTTSTLLSATYNAQSTVYNGYLYVIGGCNSSCNGNIEYAAIHADGSLGSWTASSNSLLANIQNGTAAAYNGYLYVMGGSSSYPTATNNVEYATISSNGAPGVFAYATTLFTATEDASATVYDGYLYVLAGTSNGSTPLATVQYAPIYSNGELGAWLTSSQLPTATDYANTVSYNGYIYEIGGYDTQSIDDYAQIQPAGYTSNYTATTSLPAADAYYLAASVEHNGYIYYIGGSNGTADTNLVYYDSINSNGTLGSTWTSTSSLTNASQGGSAVVYNGYIYYIGGDNDCSASSSVCYAQIGSNGLLGSWSSTTNLTVTSYGGGAFAYNGYIYYLGGGGRQDESYAPINSNGTIGSWTTSASGLPQMFGNGSTVEYGGFVYLIAGGNGGGSYNVYYDNINSNGSLGSSWQTGTSLPSTASEYYATAIAYNGYLYNIGGCNSSGCSLSTVEYIAINSNGSLGGSWTPTTSLPTATSRAASVERNGYIYEIGGCAGAGTCSLTTNVYFASINNGGPGTWQTYSSSTNLLADTADATSVTYDGFIYEIGGYNGSTDVATVDYAALNSDGTVGSWTSTTSMPETVNQATSIAYNGYVYEIGGYNGTTAVSNIYYAPINSDGTLGAWTETTSLPTAVYGATSVEYNGYIYEIGGYNGAAAVSTVEYAQIGNNGSLATQSSCPAGWSLDSSRTWCYNNTSLPTAVYGATSVEYNGYIYEIGGYNGTSSISNVNYAPINSNGTIGSWTATTSLTQPTNAATSVGYGGYIYEVGGSLNSTTGYSSVYYAPINSNGTIGSWTATTSLTQPTSSATSVVYNGYVYELGGGQTDYYCHSNSADCYNTVDYAALNTIPRVGKYSIMVNLAPAYNLTWNNTIMLPAATENASSAVYKGYIYELGGCISPNCESTNVYYAVMNANGTIGSWNSTTSLPANVENATAVAYNGFLYELGGYSGNTTYASVYYAQISSNGSLVNTLSSCPNGGTLYSGTWCSTTNLPSPTDHSTSIVQNGYIYEIGGATSGTSGITANTYFAQISSNGSLVNTLSSCPNGGTLYSGTWCSTTPLPQALDDAPSVTYNGYVYVLSGYSGSGGSTSVYYASIGSNGALGAWNTASSPTPSAVLFATAVVYGGYIYLLGGCVTTSSCSGPTSAVHFAQINSNGNIGSWMTTTALPTPLNGATTVMYNGYLYEIGGNNSGVATQTQTGSQTAVYYSSLVNNDVNPVAIEINGTNVGNAGIGGLANGTLQGLGGIKAAYANSTMLCGAFNSPANVDLGNPELGAPYALDVSSDGCGASTGLAQYLWLYFSLDDSQTATFPDVNGNHTTINSVQIFFHPANSTRLRGGMTVQNGVSSALDASPEIVPDTSKVISAVGSFYTGTGTINVTNQNLGDVIVGNADYQGNNNNSFTVSGGGVTTWHYGKYYTGGSLGFASTEVVFWGVITSTGSQTITGSSGVSEIDAQEFSAGPNTNWSADGSGATATGSSNPLLLPEMSPSSANELYYSVAIFSSSFLKGLTPGYSYDSTSYGNLVSYSTNAPYPNAAPYVTSNGGGWDADAILLKAD